MYLAYLLSDYIHNMILITVIFTALAKIYSTKHFYIAKLHIMYMQLSCMGWTGEIFIL